MTTARAVARRAAGALVRLAVTWPMTRRALNAWYRSLDSGAHAAMRHRFYRLAAKVFQPGDEPAPGIWDVRFCGRTIRLPISRGRAWLDWENAVSTMGHEVGVKEQYRRLIEARAVDLFVDVGANHGTHSLLFLAHGIPTLTFEPNAECHRYFEDACRLNDFGRRLEPVAVGATHGDLRFVYPTDETWLGSADPAVIATFSGPTTTFNVPVRTLDDYLPELSAAPGRMLLKIDVEGLEASVLRGAARVLSERQPMILFESWGGAVRESHRRAVFDLLAAHGYEIRAASDAGLSAPLTRQAFVAHALQDFYATLP